MEEISRIQPISRPSDPVQRIERYPERDRPRRHQPPPKRPKADIVELHDEADEQEKKPLPEQNESEERASTGEHLDISA